MKVQSYVMKWDLGMKLVSYILAREVLIDSAKKKRRREGLIVCTLSIRYLFA